MSGPATPRGAPAGGTATPRGLALRRRMRGVDPVVWDALIALALALAGGIEVALHDERPAPLAVGVLIMAATVTIRRTRPLVAVAAWLGAVLGMVAAGTSPAEIGTPFLTLFLLPYSAGAGLPWRQSVVAIAAMWAGVAAVYAAMEPHVLGDLFFPGMFATVFWGVGRLIRSRSELTAELHEAAVRAAESREAEAAGAVADERRRIAREMHDVVAHSVSMMVVQAGGARRILDRDPARAIAAAELIERTGRQALAEMRALLGVLHAEEHPEYAPQPTLHDLDALVERTRVAGVPVELSVDGERRELPAGLDLAAFRVVQEALTNVVKHAGGAPTEVRVHYRADAVEVRIADQGNGGGFEVHVLLPLEGEEEAALTSGTRA